MSSKSKSKRSGSGGTSKAAATVADTSSTGQDSGPATSDAPNGAMPVTVANDDPQRGDPPYPDVDRREPVLLDEPHRWHDPQVLVDEIRKHVLQSHGSEPDKALLREIADFVAKDARLDADDSER